MGSRQGMQRARTNGYLHMSHPTNDKNYNWTDATFRTWWQRGGAESNFLSKRILPKF